jgi:hypothetical protein
VLIKLELLRQILEKSSSVKFHKNPSSVSRIVPCGRTNLKKVIVLSSNVAIAPKNQALYKFTEIFRLKGIWTAFYIPSVRQGRPD